MSSRPSNEIIEEILCRFIVNLPKKEVKKDRIFFHMVEAYWFYLDFIFQNRDIHPKQPYLNERNFGQILFEKCPFRICDSRDYQKLYNDFHYYQSQIPVCGAILLNKSLDKVLLVMNMNRTNYSFPKGKINQNENMLDCAAREVWEEIGYPVTNQISENHFIQMILHGHQLNKMYILTGVDEATEFRAKTRGEIGNICWEKLELVERSNETYINQKNPFKNILPFIRELRIWLKAYKNKPKAEENKKKEEIKKNDDKTEENKNISEVNSQKSLEIIELERRYSEFEKILCSSLRPNIFEETNPFKEFIGNPSLPKFLFDEENKMFEEKKIDVKQERKETPNKEKKMKILQNKEKRGEPSRISIFERKLKEISNTTINLLATQNLKTIEKNPFMEFKFDTSDLSALFA